MESSIQFIDCPAWLDDDGAEICGLPAEVRDRYTMDSTDGPMEFARIECPSRHWFNGPVETFVHAVDRAAQLQRERAEQPSGAEASDQ